MVNKVITKISDDYFLTYKPIHATDLAYAGERQIHYNS